MIDLDDKINKARKQLNAELTKKYGAFCKVVKIENQVCTTFTSEMTNEDFWIDERTEDTSVTLDIKTFKEEVVLDGREAKDIYKRYIELLNEV